jgi:hypothetical protein
MLDTLSSAWYAVRRANALISPLCRMSNTLARISIKRSVDGLYQITFDERRYVVPSGESNNDLEPVRCCAAVEQYTRGGVGEHTRIGPD